MGWSSHRLKSNRGDYWIREREPDIYEPLLSSRRDAASQAGTSVSSMREGVSNQTLVSSGREARTLPQYVAAIVATLGGFVMGAILAWTSPTKSKLSEEYHLEVTDGQNAMIGGLLAVGAMAGAGCGGSLCNLAGRRTTICLLTVPSLVGWALILWAESVAMIIAGRVVLGVVIGALSVACPLYTTEISQTAIRGTLGTYFQLQVTIGIMFVYIVGSQTSVFHLSLTCAAIPLLLGALISLMPESPHYYLMKKNEGAARKSLQWLRGQSYNVNDEIAAMKRTIEKIESEKLSLREAFSTKPAKRGLVIGLGVMMFQQLSGINSVIFYSKDIFDAAGSKLSPDMCSIVVGSVSVLATYVSTLIVDRLGRKPLLFSSATVMALSAGVLGLFFFLKDHHHDVSNIGWLPVTSVSVFIVVFSLGFGPIPWMFLSEIFPPAIKGPGASIACLFNWFCAFLVTFSFDYVVGAIGQSYTFWLFTVISALGALFVLFVVPETKGRSLEEIQRCLGASSEENVETGVKPIN